MPRLRNHVVADPRVSDWLSSNAGGWSISDNGPECGGRLDFAGTDLKAVRDAVLTRLGVTGAELRSACAYERRKVKAAGGAAGGASALSVGLPPDVLAHLSASRGDSIEFTCMPDGSVTLRRAPDVDIEAVRAGIRAARVSPRLLARLFFVPESTVRRIVTGGRHA